MATTTAVTAQQAITDFNNYMARHGGAYRDWYVGVATDPRARLFHDHNVSEYQGAWIFHDLGTDGEARRVETHFLAKGCDGGGGGGDWRTRFAYLYRKTSFTNP